MLLFCAILILGFLEVLGIASVLPFMELLSKPDAILESSWLQRTYTFFDFQSSRNFIIACGTFVISTIALSNLLGIATTYFQLKISWNISHRMSTHLLQTYAQKPYSYFLNQNTAELRTYLIAEVAALTSGVLIPMIEFLSRTLISTIIFGLLLYVSPQVTLTMVVFLGGSYLAIYVSRQKFLKRLGGERIQANADRFRYLEEMLTGIKTVKIYGVKDFFYQRFEKKSRRFNDIQPKVQMVYATPKYILEIVAFGGILAFTMYLFISTGDLSKALPRLSLYALAGYRLLPSLQRAFAAAAKVKHNLPSLNKLYDDLVEAAEQPEIASAPKNKMPFEKSIVLDALSFSYEGASSNVLQQLDLTISKGNTLAFVGSTGSGKTTLIDIVTGLLSPTGGTLAVDDTTITTENVEQWQRNIAYVPQEVFLYDDTVRANVTIGIDEKDVDAARLEQVLKMTDIYDFISNELAEGLNTTIGERGVRLSGGQRQRLGLARALYTNPSLLILDEATSALDSITEKGIIESLKSLPDDLTVIIIAHRLSTVQYADDIFLLEDGKIVNHGMYDDLIANNQTFKRMAELSTGMETS